MTKEKPNGAMETFITTNKLMVRFEGWVQRGVGGKQIS